MKVQWIVLAALLFALITGIFAVINVDPVLVDFLFVRTETPLVLVILVSALLGGLMVGLFGIVRQYRMKRHIKQLERQLALLTPASEDDDSVMVFDDGTAGNGAAAEDLHEGGMAEPPRHRLH